MRTACPSARSTGHHSEFQVRVQQPAPLRNQWIDRDPPRSPRRIDRAPHNHPDRRTHNHIRRIVTPILHAASCSISRHHVQRDRIAIAVFPLNNARNREGIGRVTGRKGQAIRAVRTPSPRRELYRTHSQLRERECSREITTRFSIPASPRARPSAHIPNDAGKLKLLDP